MKKELMSLRFLLVLLFVFNVSAEQPVPSQFDQARQVPEVSRVVYGDLFRIPAGIWKIDQEACETLKRDHYQIDAKEGDAFLTVWATSKGYPDKLITHLSQEEKNDTEGSCNWADHGHPRIENFPKCLPLTLFIDENGKLKKDGSEVILYHKNPKNNEYIKIILTLNQRGYRYAWCGNDTWAGHKHDGGFDNCIKASMGYEKLVKPHLSKSRS
jgi:hypothetical protein